MMAQAIDDFTVLPNPTFDEILGILGHRFRQDTIYTFIGDILVSVNPNKELPIYGPQVGRDYVSALQPGHNDLPPHVFYVVNSIVTSLLRHQTPQCVLLTGESGAGKTEAVKMLVSQMLRETEAKKTWQGRNDSSSTAKNILEAINLLDMFGCAATPVNTNASRYAKLWQIFFNQEGCITGARVRTQGLDRSRVMFHEVGHTNYHVFYQLLAGLPAHQLGDYFLDRYYRILESEEGAEMFKSDDSFRQYRDDFVYLQQAMTSLGLDLGTQSHSRGGHSIIFGMLSAILNLGNIHFVPDPETDKVFIPNEQRVDIAARQLGVPVGELMTLFLANTTYVRGERIVGRNDFGEACTARNSLVRFLYSELFTWIVQQINAALQGDVIRDQKLSVSILDCPGYENLDSNCFEELCHNIADEKLQHHVNRMIFADELYDLDQEGVKGYKVKYLDLTTVVELFSYPKSRLFAIVDEESAIAKSSPASLLQKMKKQLAKNKLFVQTELDKKSTSATFVILHTKGQVKYDAGLLLTKNRDKVTAHTSDVMKHSRNPLVAHLFSTADELDHKPYRINQSKENGDISSTGSSRLSTYMASLEDLLEAVKECETHHIWCIKPNQTSQPDYFDPPFVFRQFTNIQETVCQRTRGFPVRVPIREFVERYRFLAFPLTSEIASLEGACHKILKESRQEGWEVGRTKVFLPLWGDSTLDSLLDQEVRHVVVVQSVARGFLVRRWFGRLAQTQDTHALQLSQLADDIFQNGGRAFYAQREQRDHDRRKYDRYIHGHDQHRRSRRSQHSPRYDRWGNPVDAHIESSRYSRRTSYDSDDIEDFQERVLRSVIGRKEELDTSTWCKVICMEYEREVGKVYVQEKEFIVDGSYNKFDGQRLGLGVFQNSDRDKLTEDIRGAIMEGVALSKDAEGNIWAKRLSRNDVIAKGYHDPGNHCLSAEVVLQKGRLPYQEQVKIFDAREFKSHVGLHMKGKKKGRLEFLSLIGLSFIQDTRDDLDTPCWVCLVNILALTALESNDVLQEVQMMIAGVHLKTEEETEEESNKMVIKKRHHRNSWSKTDHRDHLNAKDSPRKLREMLRRQGESVSTHMDYSWNRQPSGYAGNMMTVEDLHEMADQEQYDSYPDVLGRRNSRQRDWAKVKVTLKEMSAKQTEETEAAQKTMYTRY